MGVIKAAIGDAVLTFMWVFCASTLGLLTWVISSALGVQGIATFFITTVLVFVFVFVFSIIGDALGGASFNPTATAAFYAAGASADSLISMALRFPAQAAGAVGGALAIAEVMPMQYKHMVGGPSLKVDLHTGAMAEGILTFAITFAVLMIVLRGPNSPVLKTWLLAMATVALVIAGSSYTGPSMNPANKVLPYFAIIHSTEGCQEVYTKKGAKDDSSSGTCAFGWAYVNNWHNTWEQFYVYWICPFAGAILAALVFRVVFPPPVKKQKEA